MLEAALSCFDACDVFVAAAAPADYAPVEVAPSKIKKAIAGADWVVRLKETPDVLATVAARKKGRFVVGFAAETEQTVENAREKLARKRLDLIVANNVTQEGAGFEADTNIVTMIRSDGETEMLPKMTKRDVAEKILDAVVRGIK